MIDLDFGVFYTCYTEMDAVRNSLDLLYEIYPGIPVLLISDGGSDYSSIEASYTNLRTELSHDSRGLISRIQTETYRREDTQKYMFDSIFTFMDRIERAVDYCKKPYLLIFEPDVLVRGKLRIDENAHLLGSRVNHYHWAKNAINQVLSEIPGSIEVDYYGATPAIIKCDTFRKVINFFRENTHYVKRFCEIDPNFPNYDIFITVFFAALGYREHQNPELTECLRNPFWRASGHPLLHQFREFYPVGNYDGRHQRT